MCLAVPVCVTHIDEATQVATVALGDVKKQVSVILLDEVAVGDYVLLHVGYALHRISPEEAERTLAMFDEAGMLDEFGERET